MKFAAFLIYIYLITLLLGCKQQTHKDAFTFSTLTADKTGITFSNTLHPTPAFNMLKYMYYYNGAGVGASDFNNDGKIDLFFASNQEQNKLFINEGDMHFKDATKEANIPNDNAWSTGVSVVDINNDSLMDIYICRVSQFKNLKGRNQLLVCKEIKNGIPFYVDEAAMYGLDYEGFGTQAAFFDYDNDGDVDMFLLNHSVNHNGNFAPRANFLNTYDTLTGDQFFKNVNGHFENVTRACGINSSKIGYGLGIAVSDVNVDGWPDIYIGNDFHENDYLYINQKNGTFKEELDEHIMHTSQFSMGVDVADVNNDAYPDIMSMDMLPDDPIILKRSLGEDEYQTFLSKSKIGYSPQYSRNNLQLNRRNGMFSEVAFYSGISATDWSWSSLFFDFDNDGLKDIFISNGIPKRLNDIDYVTYLVNDAVQQKIQTNTMDEQEMAAIYKFPAIKLPNRFYKNIGSARFTDIGKSVEGSPNTFSNGALYADLDNDGDLDIVVNNINEAASVYQNNTNSSKGYTDITLIGHNANKKATGAKVYVFTNKEIIAFEKFGTRGFMSSTEIPLHVSYGSKTIDSTILVWPDNSFDYVRIDSNTKHIEVKWKAGLPLFNYAAITNFYKQSARPFKDVTVATGINFLHQENDFNEYNREILLPKIFGTEGPAMAVGDMNGDGLDDIYIGSSKWQTSALFLQNKNGKFSKSVQPLFLLDSTYEDVAATMVDVNNDHFTDLVIASGGNEYFSQEKWLQPRIYLNDGKGNLHRLDNAFTNIYTTQSCVAPFDFNNDGFVDLFIGGRVTPFKFGITPSSYLLQNDGTGHFIDVTKTWSKDLATTGFVTNAVWVDINNDHLKDLVIAKEWGTIEVYINHSKSLVRNDITEENGWWNFVLPIDIDADGDIDFIAGNQGLNCRLQASTQYPVKMFYNDFDDNGTREQIITYYQNGKEIPLASKMDLEKQMPFIKKKYLYASDFATASLNDLFGKKLESATLFTADYFANAVLINDGKGNFKTKALPWQAQLSCLKSAAIFDANGDRLPDIIIGGNFYEQTMPLNRNDADFGTVLINKGGGNFDVENINGVSIKNQIRNILPIKINGKNCFAFARNNDSLLIIQ